MSQPRIVPLSKTRHAALTFSPLEDYSFTAAMNSMPLPVSYTHLTLPTKA